MEFRFNISKIFRNNISRIGNSLLPLGFVAADRRTALDTTAYVAEIINTIGQASGAAQGLNQPVTTADRLRNSDDQVIYLLTEDNDKNGLVLGILKIGKKSLYVFDKNGETRHVQAPCILDFYVHESQQRRGLGKTLFEYMLDYEGLLPEQFAIDRPSEKLLGFLKKHYALTQKIPQMNNFVIYEGFFSAQEQSKEENNASAKMHITASPNSNLFGPQFVSDGDNYKRRPKAGTRHDPSLSVQTHVLGRYGAPRPQCSLNQIIHNKPTSVTAEPNSKQTRDTTPDITDEDTNDVIDGLVEEFEAIDTKSDELSPSPVSPPEHVKFADVKPVAEPTYYSHENEYFTDNHQDYYEPKRSMSPFQYNKRQTGKKNMSSIVVGCNDKIEFTQTDDRGFGSVKINSPIGFSSSRTYENLNDSESLHSRDSEQTRTADGFFDLKFYSHPLW